jgi:DNA helicase MCM9
MNHPQSQAVEAETSPGSSGNDPREEPKFRMSAQQELSCGTHTSLPGSSPLRSPPEDSLSHLGPSGSINKKYSTELKDSRDDSLDWFDFMITPQIELKNTVLVSPAPKTTEENVALKISNNKSHGMDKSEPGQRNKLEAGQFPSSGATGALLTPCSVKGKKAKRGALVSETAELAAEPDLVLTHHVPSQLHKLRKKEAQGSCRSTIRAPSRPVAPSLPQAIGVLDPERTSETPKRKRPKSLAQTEEPELESAETSGPPVAKLAKFTFKQKSKLIHSPEYHSHMSSGTTKIAVHSPKTPQHKRREAVVPAKGTEKLTPTSGNRSFDRLQDKTKELSQQPPEKDGSREEGECGPEKRIIQPELELGNETGSSHLTCERDQKEEVSCSNKSSKVHAGTLARLANFSFTCLLESKSESLPLERKKWGEGGPRTPPTTTAPLLGSKRKSFQLQTSTEKLILSKSSLFTLPELDDEALDFDWDEEMRKKP